MKNLIETLKSFAETENPNRQTDEERCRLHIRSFGAKSGYNFIRMIYLTAYFANEQSSDDK
jgi:hypothetical protein